MRVVDVLKPLALDQGADAHEERALIFREFGQLNSCRGGKLDGPHLNQYSKKVIRGASPGRPSPMFPTWANNDLPKSGTPDDSNFASLWQSSAKY